MPNFLMFLEVGLMLRVDSALTASKSRAQCSSADSLCERLRRGSSVSFPALSVNLMVGLMVFAFFFCLGSRASEATLGFFLWYPASNAEILASSCCCGDKICTISSLGSIGRLTRGMES